MWWMKKIKTGDDFSPPVGRIDSWSIVVVNVPIVPITPVWKTNWGQRTVELVQTIAVRTHSNQCTSDCFAAYNNGCCWWRNDASFHVLFPFLYSLKNWLQHSHTTLFTFNVQVCKHILSWLAKVVFAIYSANPMRCTAIVAWILPLAQRTIIWQFTGLAYKILPFFRTQNFS